MSESKLKKQILLFMFFAKIIAALFLIFHWQTGGYSTSEMLTSITLILPLFTLYLSAMFKDVFKAPYKDKTETLTISEKRKVKGFIVGITYMVFPLYFLAIIYVISLKPQPGGFSFLNLQMSIAAIESFFGIYIGQIVNALFRNEKEGK